MYVIIDSRGDDPPEVIGPFSKEDAEEYAAITGRANLVTHWDRRTFSAHAGVRVLQLIVPQTT